MMNDNRVTAISAPLRSSSNHKHATIISNNANNNQLKEPDVIATLGVDCKVYPKNERAAEQLANLINYKIRTETDIVHKKSMQTLSITSTPVIDMGKQLLRCARDSDMIGVKDMIDRDAPFTSDWLGMTALHFAAMNDQFEMCDLLLKSGVNKDSRTKVDRTPLHLACYYGHKRIVTLLLSKNCQINPRDMLFMTPLHWAVEKRHKDITRLLLKHRADVMGVSKFGKTPIALAVLTEQADVLEDLQEARKAQLERELHVQQQKEVSAAVNSIMSDKKVTTSNNTEVPNYDKAKLLHEKVKKESENSSRRKSNGNSNSYDVNKNSTMQLLKKHGISLQKDDDESKDLLNTALRNGRQLVLSEGGKMLLSKAVYNIKNGLPSLAPIQQRTQRASGNNTTNNNNNGNSNHNINLENNTNLNINNTAFKNNNSNQVNNNIKNKVHITTVPLPRPIKVLSATQSKSAAIPAECMQMLVRNKPLNSNLITDNQILRLISIDDYKSLVIKKSDGKNENAVDLKPDCKLHENIADAETHTKEEVEKSPARDLVTIIKVGTSDSESSESVVTCNENGQCIKKAKLNFTKPATTKTVTVTTPPLRRIAIPKTAITCSSTNKNSNNSNNNNTNNNNNNNTNNNNNQINCNSVTAKNKSITQKVTNNAAPMSTAEQTLNKQNVTKISEANKKLKIAPGSVIPILSQTEICRHLFNLGRQHNDLQRRFELSQKEKRCLQLRIERLEQIIQLQRSNEDNDDNNADEDDIFILDT